MDFPPFYKTSLCLTGQFVVTLTSRKLVTKQLKEVKNLTGTGPVGGDGGSIEQQETWRHCCVGLEGPTEKVCGSIGSEEWS